MNGCSKKKRNHRIYPACIFDYVLKFATDKFDKT